MVIQFALLNFITIWGVCETFTLKSHEYTITVLGQELIRFFRNYERKRYMSSGGR